MDMKKLNIIVEILIILSLVSFALETVSTLNPHLLSFLVLFEKVAVTVFLIEYIIRLIKGKSKYLKSFFGIIDLISIVPGLIFIFPKYHVLKMFRLVRLLRMFRFLRITRVWNAVVKVKKELISYMILNFVILYILSVAMYYVERGAQPDKFGTIPEAFWWAVTTLTTIGYGDVVPITVAGKCITAFVVVLGVGIITIPTGLIASSLIKTKAEKPGPDLESLRERVEELELEHECLEYTDEDE